jgi:hypothetical protein
MAHTPENTQRTTVVRSCNFNKYRQTTQAKTLKIFTAKKAGFFAQKAETESQSQGRAGDLHETT